MTVLMWNARVRKLHAQASHVTWANDPEHLKKVACQ